MKKMKIKELCTFLPKSKIKAGEGLENGKYVFFTSSDIKTLRINDFLFDDEAIIIGTGGKPSCNYYYGKFAVSTDNFVLKSDKIKIKYLYYFLRNNNLNILENGFHGAGLKHISKDYVNDIMVSIVDEETQINIINDLDLINFNIQLCNSQLKKYDEIVKSQFIEMFGELKNKVSVKDCCKVHSRIGWQSLTKNEHLKEGYSLLVTGTDLIDKKINYDTCVYVTKERYDMDTKIQLKNDDILITKDGTIGKVAIVNNLYMPATLNSGLFVVRPDERFDKHYISYVFKSDFFNDFVESVKTGATIKHLNQEALFKFEIPVPTIEQQNKFADFVQQIDKSKYFGGEMYA